MIIPSIYLAHNVLCREPSDSAQYRDDLQLENEQMSSKVWFNLLWATRFLFLILRSFSCAQLKFIEQDCAALAEKLEKEKDAHTATTRDLQVRTRSLRDLSVELD